MVCSSLFESVKFFRLGAAHGSGRAVGGDTGGQPCFGWQHFSTGSCFVGPCVLECHVQFSVQRSPFDSRTSLQQCAKQELPTHVPMLT